MSAVEWVDPPSYWKNSPVFTPAVMAALRSRPGEWALVKKGHKGSAVASMFTRRHPEFEATTRKAESGGLDIYARYVGGAS